jgi:hypothetical protein
MFKRKGQISLEYMIITGFILVVIIIPTFLLLFTTTNKSVYSKINIQKIEDLGLGVLNDAKQMYYLGLYSNKVVEYNIPNNVVNMYILDLTRSSDGGKEYYLGIVVQNGRDTEQFNFLSDVPISSTLSNYVDIDSTLNSQVDACDAVTGNTCTFYSFKDNAISPGKRRFKIETLYDTDLNIVISKIYPIIDSQIIN